MSWAKSLGLIVMVALAGCAQNRNAPIVTPEAAPDRDEAFNDTGGSIFEFFDRPDTEAVVQVNRYLWAASLDVLSFLPIESVDPFSGLIVTGFGRPPGGSRSYRATVYISDPALDARSLNVSLLTSGGPVSAETTRAVEDAILSRARQLRIEDGKR